MRDDDGFGVGRKTTYAKPICGCCDRILLLTLVHIVAGLGVKRKGGGEKSQRMKKREEEKIRSRGKKSKKK